MGIKYSAYAKKLAHISKNTLRHIIHVYKSDNVSRPPRSIQFVHHH